MLNRFYRSYNINRLIREDGRKIQTNLNLGQLTVDWLVSWLIDGLIDWLIGCLIDISLKYSYLKHLSPITFWRKPNLGLT